MKKLVTFIDPQQGPGQVSAVMAEGVEVERNEVSGDIEAYVIIDPQMMLTVHYETGVKVTNVLRVRVAAQAMVKIMDVETAPLTEKEVEELKGMEQVFLQKQAEQQAAGRGMQGVRPN